jgi:hypothetical protein
MKLGLTLYAVLAFCSLVGASIWATGQVSIVPAIQDLIANPAANYNAWFVATLFDTVYAFGWFWLWIAYKERSWLARGLWLLAVLATGNMAMAVYALIQLAKLPANATVEDFLLRQPRAGR